MKRSMIRCAWLFLAVCICSCIFPQAAKKYPANPSNPIKQVAILPLQNDTNDVEGPEFVRQKLIQEFQARNYSVMPASEVDSKLRDKLGVSLGGQLQTVAASKFKDALGVEGVVLGKLMDFGETTTGIYNVRKVRAVFKMLNTGNGKVAWEKGIGVKSVNQTADIGGTATAVAAELIDEQDKDVPWITVDAQARDLNAKENLALDVGQQIFQKATGTHLEFETNEMIENVTSSLPAGPGIKP